MSTNQAQVVDPQEFIDILDYAFSGDSYTIERKRALVEAYRSEGTIYHAAKVVRVSRKTVYNWINADPQLAAAIEESKEDCYDQVETSVFKKAVGGSTLDAMFYLKAKRPQFRDRVAVDVQQIQRDVRAIMEEIHAALSLTQITPHDDKDKNLLLPAIGHNDSDPQP